MSLFDVLRDAVKPSKLAADAVAAVTGTSIATEVLASSGPTGLENIPAPPGIPEWCWPALVAVLTAGGRLALVVLQHYLANRRKDGK